MDCVTRVCVREKRAREEGSRCEEEESRCEGWEVARSLKKDFSVWLGRWKKDEGRSAHAVVTLCLAREGQAHLFVSALIKLVNLSMRRHPFYPGSVSLSPLQPPAL